MTLSIYQARKLLPEGYKERSDEEIQKILDFFYAISQIIIDDVEENQKD